jgi:hypothetical protein
MFGELGASNTTLDATDIQDIQALYGPKGAFAQAIASLEPTQAYSPSPPLAVTQTTGLAPTLTASLAH